MIHLARRYAAWSGSIAIAAALLLFAVASTEGVVAARWSLLGWLVMALTGVLGGSWLAAAHGRPGSRFIVALGTCMLARLFGSAAGAVAAALSGGGAVWPYLAGLGVTFLPLQVFEVGWFLRKGRRTARAAANDARHPTSS
jgi:hypothetical protein